jgi:RNA polymerase sigma-70 factor (ECF subfamily)
MLRSRSEAEDVAQETFIRAYQALSRFDGRSEPYTWLYRIAVNLSLNTIRSRKSSRISGDSADPRLEAFMVDPRAGAANPGETAAVRQQYQALCEGIDTLSDTLRTTLILVCVDGLSHENVAAILGAPEGTIAWRVHEARRKLRDFMGTRGFKLDGGES